MTAGDREKLRKIARELWSIAEGQAARDIPWPISPDAQQLDYLALANAEIRRRQARREAFPDKFLREPAWDILLALFARQLEGKRSTSKLAHHAAGIPGTTALRWLDHLVSEGLISRKTSPEDNRCTDLILTASGAQRIASALEHMTKAENKT